ncbi:MAG: hypothetical protein EBR82_53345 [Caulobacteraceae bacterium]|nr:hypothetical protein [Caulobacteraceae bacterium]
MQDLLRQRQEQEMMKQRQSKIQAAMQLPMEQRISELQNLGAYDIIKNMAESQTAARRAGLFRQPGMEMENPFQPFTLATSPGVKQLAEQYTKSFEQGVLTEEQANQRILDLQRMEDAFISRTESAQERKDRENRDRLDRQERDRLAKLEREQRDLLSRQERQQRETLAKQEREERQAAAAQERETKRLEGTEGQKLSAGFADRMVRSQNILNTLEGAGVGLPTITTSIAGGVPFVGGYLERQVADTNQQRYKQAAMNWIRANLRKESGAAIGVDEMEREYETYFPLPGDDPDTIQAKKEARDATTRAMIINAGPVFKMPELPKVKISETKKGKPSSTADEIWKKFGLETR